MRTRSCQFVPGLRADDVRQVLGRPVGHIRIVDVPDGEDSGLGAKLLWRPPAAGFEKDDPRLALGHVRDRGRLDGGRVTQECAGG